MPNLLNELEIIEGVESYLVTIYDASAHTKIGTLTELQTENKTSLVNAINEVVSDLSTETQNRENADTNLSDRIDTNSSNITTLNSNVGVLTNLDTEDKTNLVNAINEVLDNAGIYNKSTPDSGLTTNIGLKEGTYYVTTDTTITAQLVVPKGAIINVSNGVTLTISGDILAGRYQIFSGDGDVVIANSIIAYPEWFNDDLVKTCNSANNVSLACKTYTVNEDIVINKSNFTLYGVSYGTNWTNSNCSRVVFTNGNFKLGTTSTTVINEYPRNINIRRVNIQYQGSGSAINVYGVVRAIIEECYIVTSSGTSGITFEGAVGTFVKRCYVQVIDNAKSAFAGFFVNNSGTRKNMSLWISECTFGDTGTPTGRSYGYRLYGSIVSDIFLDKCESAGGNVGLCLDSLTDVNSVDILINQCDFDSCTENACQIYQCSAGAVSFTGCYFNNRNDITTPLFNVVQSTISILLNACQFVCTNNAQVGVNLTHASKIIGDITVRGGVAPVGSVDATNEFIRYLHNGTLGVHQYVEPEP